MAVNPLDQAYKPTQDPKLLQKLGEWILATQAGHEDLVESIQPHIWRVEQPGYKLLVVVTHLLVLLDAPMFAMMPKDKNAFFEELLSLNSHHVKNAKLCLVRGQVHLRIVCEHKELNPHSFEAYLAELKDLFPLLFERLAKKFYPDGYQPEEET